MISVDYRISPAGWATDFSETERPIIYAKTLTNRFLNINGAGQRRPGWSVYGSAVTGAPTLTRLHEHISAQGSATLIASDNGNGWRLQDNGVWASSFSGKAAARLISTQVGNKLIFCNGSDRNFYTDDGGLTTQQMYAVISRGSAGTSSSATSLTDNLVTNWLGQTLVSTNDIVYNISNSAYGVVTAVGSAAITHTIIGSTGTGSGFSTQNQVPGDIYIVEDHVDLNLFKRSNGVYENVAIAGSGSNSTTLRVSGINFATTVNDRLAVGDFVYNTTRACVTRVNSISASSVGVTTVTSQAAGDSLVFLKSAMPIASYVHTHYGRLYMVDARRRNRIIISAPDDPEDVTTFAKTLDSSSFQFGTQQSRGDTIQALATFQQYLLIAGRKNLLLFSGINPIVDTSATTKDFEPVTLFPDGCVSPFGLITNGNDAIYISPDGVQSINVGSDSNTTIQNNASQVIRSYLRTAIKGADEDDVQVTYYPRRSWVLTKVGNEVAVLNVSQVINEQGALEARGTWSLFNGSWAEFNHYFVRQNGDLLGCGANGIVAKLDDDDLTDNGTIIPTDYVSAWLRLEEPQKTVRIKKGAYIKPVFENATGVVYNISVIAGYEGNSFDSITTTANGGPGIGELEIGVWQIGVGDIAQQKLPIRWRGEEVQVRMQSQSSAGPDVISGFTLYGSVSGRK